MNPQISLLANKNALYIGHKQSDITAERILIPTLETESKGNSWIDFLVVIIASGIARGRDRATTTTTAKESRNLDGGHTAANRLTETYNLGLKRPSLILDTMFWSE